MFSPQRPACERARLSGAEGGAGGGAWACERRGTFCTVETAETKKSFAATAATDLFASFTLGGGEVTH